MKLIKTYRIYNDHIIYIYRNLIKCILYYIGMYLSYLQIIIIVTYKYYTQIRTQIQCNIFEFQNYYLSRIFFKTFYQKSFI